LIVFVIMKSLLCFVFGVWLRVSPMWNADFGMPNILSSGTLATDYRQLTPGLPSHHLTV